MLSLLSACDSLQRTAARVIPVLELADPDLAADPVICDPAFSGPEPTVDCVIDEISCGTIIEANSSVGSNNWGDDFYRGIYCTPESHDYDNAPEAVYRLTIPPSMMATVQLDSNCVDLDVAGIMWGDEDVCPKLGQLLHVCEMDTSRGGGTIQMSAVDTPTQYLVAVDGKNGESGNYRLSVSCHRYR